MIDLFGSVKGLLKLETVSTDNTVFRLHYKATFAILIASTLLVTSKQYIGDPIDCIVDGVPPNVMDTYCWVHATFTVPTGLSGKKGSDVAHPGVKQPENPEDVKYHKYYQWVVFVLFLQALFFYLPRYIWKNVENGRIGMLAMNLTNPIVDDQTKDHRIKIVSDYCLSNVGNNGWYAYKFVFCEVLNFVNVICQIYFTDAFLGGEFTTYGADVFSYDKNDTDREDPMSRVFPKMTKCTFHKYGASGTIQTIDGLCVLPVNIINEKIYVFLWLWFILLAVISGVALVYRILTMFLGGVRFMVLKALAPLSDPHQLRSVNGFCHFGDWFILCRLAKNMDPHIYREFIAKLSDKFGKKPGI